MKHKLKALMLAIFSVFFVFGVKAQADTISIVSDTAYAPFEFKDSDQTYKGIDHRSIMRSTSFSMPSMSALKSIG